jgi:hypothetical protein
VTFKTTAHGTDGNIGKETHQGHAVRLEDIGIDVPETHEAKAIGHERGGDLKQQRVREEFPGITGPEPSDFPDNYPIKTEIGQQFGEKHTRQADGVNTHFLIGKSSDRE